ncbi:chemotaxis protein CheD [bacterium]|nr:chemotaxis protein CheD [bacterium]
MNHFLLPHSHLAEQASKYGDYATRKLISMMRSNGAMHSSLIAKVFGGANVVSSIRHQIGEQNIQMAKQILAENNIEIVAEDTGGFKSRFIHFDTSNGKVTIRYK